MPRSLLAPRRSRLAFAAATLVAGYVSFAAAEEPDAGEALREIREGRARNYSAVPDLRVELLQTYARSAPQPRADGAGQRTEHRIVVHLSGARLRHELADADGKLLQVWAFDGRLWSRYVPEGKSLWRRDASGLPGMFPVDPRESGSDEMRESFLEQLSRGDVVSIDRGPGPGRQSVLRLVTRHAPELGLDPRSEFHFDPAKNTLPIKVIRSAGDDYYATVELSYRELRPDVYFPQEVVHRSWAGDVKPTPEPKPEDASSVLSVVTKNVTIAGPGELGDELWRIDVPPGTRVDDGERIYTTK